MHEQYALAEEIRSAPILQTHAKASVAPENVVKESNTLNGQLKIEIPQGIDGSGIKVSEDYLTQKIARLSAIMPQLSGLSGILHLETWTPDTTDIVFDRADL